MNMYTYWDNKQKTWEKDHWVSKKLFECLAESILISDKLFEEATGINPVKAPHIGCTISPKTP
jgi:hypothetical protein